MDIKAFLEEYWWELVELFDKIYEWLVELFAAEE